MNLILFEKPAKPKVIQGFPSVGMIGTIATEYLIEHLNAKYIGRIIVPELAPMVIIHEGRYVDPIGIFYAQQYNLVIIHVATPLTDVEWQFTELLIELSKQLDVCELITIEGIVDTDATQPTVYAMTDSKSLQERLTQCKIPIIGDGVVTGVGAALMQRAPLAAGNECSFFFCTTHSQLPDSSAAASVIVALDVYLDLKVDPQPLLARANEMEEKFRGLLDASMLAKDEKDKKSVSYVG